ncbi:PaaI family thioesterase [Nocardioides immobilis]|uniref:Acyl-coenzyme A thioesterase THEM4 n=1 Tax=Nocardioides immobilis TaxID=2049295 RepID=A0A417Y7B1_9ACTN|nr:PaaI family thioesterase [Nocardioides immobilis]RHW28559.1 PaaI family thioesterase [Nocardioides immobilis]
MTGYLDDIRVDPSEIAAQEALYGPLTQSIRSLIDAAIRTEVDSEDIAGATAALTQVASLLRARQIDGSYGAQPSVTGVQRSWASPVIGVRNPIAPPLILEHEPDGRVWARFRLGAGYEGPPSLVHGGVSALILDHVLGEAVHASGHWGMTGTLTLRYRRPTPLNRPLRADARIDRVEGRKVYADGSISDERGITVEASGIFILPTGYAAAR